MKRLLQGLGLLLAAGSAGAQMPERVAAAQSTAASPAPADEARDAFNRGVQLFLTGDTSAAAAVFARAYELSADYRILYNMAQVEADRAHPAAALRLLALYSKHGGTEIDAQRRDEVAVERVRLERQAAALRVTTNVEDATLWVDGAPLGPVSSELIWLDPGEHHVSVEADGYTPTRHGLRLGPGARRLLAMPLRPALRRAPVPDAAPTDTPDRTPLWISLGATGASAGLAIAFVTLTRAADAELERELQRFPVDTAALGAARSRLRTLSTVSDTALGVSAVAAGLSLYFALRPSARPETGKAPSSNIRLAPLGLGVSLRGSF